MAKAKVNLVAVVSNVFDFLPFFTGVIVAGISLNSCSLGKRIFISLSLIHILRAIIGAPKRKKRFTPGGNEPISAAAISFSLG